jgi:mono/diheme cytochrome c family protein
VNAMVMTLCLLAGWPGDRVARGDGPKDHEHKDHEHKDHEHKDHDHTEEPGGAGHVHAPVPPEYRSAHVPSAAWTDPRMIARGREIYMVRCAVCHGDEGRGDGPAVTALPIKPPDLRDPVMVGEMAGNYWFWRISEGGLVEPFRAQGSIMPAWKDELSVEDRWAVIAYQHTFSGHRGPHVTSEHPQMVSPAHASHGAPAAPAGAAPAGAPAGGPPATGAPAVGAPAPGGAHKH